MIVRQLDANGDWTFGYSKQNYLVNKAAVGQNIATRLKEWLGDCFFNLLAGIDWEKRLGSTKQEELLKSDTYNIIKDTDGVLGVLEHTLSLQNRQATIITKVQTAYGELAIGVVNA